MAKEKATREKAAAEITFVCKFCGKSKPLSEMALQTRFFPVLAACRECEKALLNLGVQSPPEVQPEEPETSQDADTVEQ
jgi:hypothetical protein